MIFFNNNRFIFFLNRWKENCKLKNGEQDLKECATRILAQVPVSPQSYSYSPYLDLEVFSYDDKLISVLERPKPCTENPISFHSRSSGRALFRMVPSGVDQPNGIVAFIVHPYEPFIISVRRARNQQYYINFHIRNENTIFRTTVN